MGYGDGEATKLLYNRIAVLSGGGKTWWHADLERAKTGPYDAIRYL